MISHQFLQYIFSRLYNQSCSYVDHCYIENVVLIKFSLCFKMLFISYGKQPLKIVISAVLSQTRFIKRILTVDIRLVSFIPIQRLDNNRNACTNLIQYTCLTCVQKRFEEFFKCLFHERGQLSSAKKKVPMHKDGNRCWCSQGKRWVKYGNWKLKYFE